MYFNPEKVVDEDFQSVQQLESLRSKWEIIKS